MATALASLCLFGQVEAEIPPGLARSSHERMVRALAQVADLTPEGHPYLGSFEARRLEQQLSTLPADASVQTRSSLNYRLGIALLYLGRERQAIARLDSARSLYMALPVRDPAVASELEFRLGLAYLRLGETENCCLRFTTDSCILPIREGGIHKVEEGSRRAGGLFREVLRDAPPGSKQWMQARWLLNIACMTLGEHPQSLPPDLLIPLEAFRSEAEFPRLLNVAPRLGVDTFGLSGGVIADDFDNDYHLDLLVSNWDTRGQLRFFRNGADGTFADATGKAGLRGIYGGLNLVQADYDNDGFVDALVLRGAWSGRAGRHPNSLLRNDGGSGFSDVSFAAGLGERHFPTQTGSWADCDLDGDLDLYIGNESTEELSAPSQLFLNLGNGRFDETALQAGVGNHRFSKGVAWGDYDGDGFPDLYVSNLDGFNRLYRNNRDGTFTDAAMQLGVAWPRSSFPCWFWDFDNDGDLDLYVASYEAGIEHLAASYLGLPHDAEMARLYRNDGTGGFADAAADLNLLRPTTPMGSNFGDIDNDGFLDFYLGTGDVHYEDLMPNMLYLNDRGGGFLDVTAAAGMGHLQKGHGIAFADFDNDGDQDVFAEMGGAYPGDRFSDTLYENPGFGNRWLSVRLVGTGSNRSAIGARIKVAVDTPGGPRSIYKSVGSGGSFGANPLRQTIGLGDAVRIEKLEVYWPSTGRTQLFPGVPMDAFIEVVEGKDRFTHLDLAGYRLGGS